MSLTILSVAYPLAPVSPDAVGGAEQILSRLDAALEQRGHRSIVVACEGRQVEGMLVPVPLPRASTTPRTDRAPTRLFDRPSPGSWRAFRRCRASSRCRLSCLPARARRAGPRDLAPAAVLVPAGGPAPSRPDTWLHCGEPGAACGLPARSPAAAAHPQRRGHRGRAAREAAVRIDARAHLSRKGRTPCHRGGEAGRIPLLIAGEVFPYETHRRYFDEEVQPRLDAAAPFSGPVGLVRKRRLLGAARCVLVPSLAPETSSLAARRPSHAARR